MIVRNIGHRGRSRSWRALRSASDMAWRICTCTLDEPLVIAWRRVLAIEVIDDLGQVAGQPLAFGFGHAAPPQQGSAFPDTGQNTLMLPMCALSAPRQRKPLESHDLDTTARVHHVSRRRGSGLAARGASAAGGDAGDRVSPYAVSRAI